MMMNRRPCRGFTLIELLVVIAIVMVVVAILLPGMAEARRIAWRVISLSNIRQISIGANTYREDYKGFMPLTLTYYRGSGPTGNFRTECGWCTWSFGGKNNDGDWGRGTSRFQGTRTTKCFDVEAGDRPLNPYLYPDVRLEAPQFPTQLLPDDPRRGIDQAFIFKDPSDVFSYQRSQSFRTNPTSVFLSSYDDVGTSYHFNVKWFRQVNPPLPFARAFNFGCDRMRLADAFAPDRMVWVNDQYSDVVAGNLSTSFKLKNGYGHINKSVMGFMDGHADYHPVFPGNGPKSYKNEFYTFVFEDLRLPED